MAAPTRINVRNVKIETPGRTMKKTDSKPINIIDTVEVGDICVFHCRKRMCRLKNNHETFEPIIWIEISEIPILLIESWAYPPDPSRILYVFLYDNKKWGILNTDKYFCFVEVIT